MSLFRFESFFQSSQTPHLWCVVGLDASPLLTWNVVDDFGDLARTYPYEPWLQENWLARTCFYGRPIVDLTPEWH